MPKSRILSPIDRPHPQIAAVWSNGGGRGLSWLAKSVLDACDTPTIHFAAREGVAGEAPRHSHDALRTQRALAAAYVEGRQVAIIDATPSWARSGAGILDFGALVVGSADCSLDAAPLAALARRVRGTGVVVLPSEARLPRTVASALRARVVTYGLNAAADVRAVVRRRGFDGMELEVTTPLGDGTLTIRRPGLRAVRESLGALAFALATGIPLVAALDALARVRGIHGAMEQVVEGPVAAFIDDARSPAALKSAINDLRECGARRVFAVLGVEGDRDGASRSKLASIATANCDMTWLTVSHSRSEDPGRLALEMVDGLADVVHCEIEFDRARALRMALSAARAGDAVLIVGLGVHADVLEVGDRLVPCDDRAIIRDMLGAGVLA